MTIHLCAWLSVAFGLFVIAGWHMGLPELVQIQESFAPMQYNTALCFLLSGIALLLAGFGKRPTARVFSGLVLITGLLTLLQYASSIELGIDELFFKHYIFTETSHPGRMSPLTALTFSLSGTALLLTMVTRKWKGFTIAAGILSSLVVSLGTVAVFGYFTGLSGAYGWGHFTQMAMHTATGVIMVGAGQMALVWRSGASSVKRSPAWLPYAAGIAALSATFVFWNALLVREETEIKRAVMANAETVRNEIVARLDSRIKALDRLAKRWEFSETPSREAWEDDALNFLADFTDYRTISWTDKETQLRWIVPLAENEAVLAADPDSGDRQQKAFEIALKRDEAWFSRPVELPGGEPGLLLIIPLTTRGQFGGYMVATLSLESFLESTLPPGLAEGYAVSLTEDGQPFYQRSSFRGKTNDGFPVSIPVTLNGADWIIKVEPEPTTLATLKSPYPAALLVLGTLFSALLVLSIHFSRKAVTRSLEVDESNLKLKETHVELASARDAALESTRLKSRFLANMSHEIRTPMNGVVGMAELLSHTGLNRIQSDYLGTIRESADLLLDIINDILDSSKIESGKLIFENRDFRIHSLVESSLDVVAAAACAKDLELAGIVHAGVFPYLRGDSGRVRQVLTNILGNAVKFTKNGEVTVSVSLISETPEKVSLEFEIRDTGIGISPENQLHIFDAFNQADGSNTRQYGGTGLGLTICRQIVEALGGSIFVTSEPGTGSIFSFRLNFEKQREPSALPVPADPLPDRLRFLAVDDNATNRDILRLQLANLGIRSENVADGEAAIEILRRENAGEDPFHFAILDMQMPGMDGLTLAGKITADPLLASTRLILLSSLWDHIDEAELQRLGIEAYLVKPLKQSQLETILLSLITGEAPPIPEISKTHIAATCSEPTPPILVVDDNAVNRKVTLLQLERLGHSADTATNGAEALDALKTRAYGIILMDCQMPVMDGFDATREIRTHHPEPIRIIAMTANAMHGDKEKCLDAGMDDYLSKPIQPEELARAICAGKSAKTVALSEPDKEQIDLNQLRKITCGNEEMFRTISADYLTQAEEILAEISDAIRENDSIAVTRLAHKLAGSSATCGMNALTSTLRELENNPPEPHALHQKTITQLAKIREQLGKHMKEIEPR